jgi:exopolysaccharide biosynthesis polyprenyl glycosylphosphotransferase
MILLTSIVVALLAWLWLLASRGEFASRVLIVGSGPLANRLVAEMETRRLRYRVAAVVADPALVDGTPTGLLAGPLVRLGQIIDELRPDRVVIALADRRGRLPMTDLLMARVGGIAIEEGVQCLERLTRKVAIEALTPSALIASGHFRKTHWDLAAGRTVSLLASLAAIIVLAPLFAVIAIAIKIDSPGPVLFVHDRAGLRGRRIRLLKFRTMRPSSGPTTEWEKDNNHRITSVGAWLRRYRLDELPQLLNVLRGDMNLVGPRPHPISNVALFSREIPFYAVRSVVRPGLTGWAQVRQGYANDLAEETEKMRYDLYYIKHMSVWLDLRILASTFSAVLTGRGQTVTTARVRREARHSPAASLGSTRLVGG